MSGNIHVIANIRRCYSSLNLDLLNSLEGNKALFGELARIEYLSEALFNIDPLNFSVDISPSLSAEESFSKTLLNNAIEASLSDLKRVKQKVKVGDSLLSDSQNNLSDTSINKRERASVVTIAPEKIDRLTKKMAVDNLHNKSSGQLAKFLDNHRDSNSKYVASKLNFHDKLSQCSENNQQSKMFGELNSENINAGDHQVSRYSRFDDASLKHISIQQLNTWKRELNQIYNNNLSSVNIGFSVLEKIVRHMSLTNNSTSAQRFTQRTNNSNSRINPKPLFFSEMSSSSRAGSFNDDFSKEKAYGAKLVSEDTATKSRMNDNTSSKEISSRVQDISAEQVSDWVNDILIAEARRNGIDIL